MEMFDRRMRAVTSVLSQISTNRDAHIASYEILSFTISSVSICGKMHQNGFFKESPIRLCLT